MSETEQRRTVWVEVYADDIMLPNGGPIHDGVVLAMEDEADTATGIYDEYIQDLQPVYTPLLEMLKAKRQ